MNNFARIIQILSLVFYKKYTGHNDTVATVGEMVKGDAKALDLYTRIARKISNIYLAIAKVKAKRGLSVFLRLANPILLDNFFFFSIFYPHSLLKELQISALVVYGVFCSSDGHLKKPNFLIKLLAPFCSTSLRS